MNMKVRECCCRGTTVQPAAPLRSAIGLLLRPIAEDVVRSAGQRSIIANSAEQKAHFGVSLLNNESTSLK